MNPTLLKLMPAAETLLLTIVILFITSRFILRATTSSSGKNFRNQMIMLGLTAVGGFLFIMVLPWEPDDRPIVLNFLGILVTAGITLSSTSILGNAMAGLMIRAVGTFRLGDFIEVGEHFGRVSDMGLVQTEIQTEDRDLKTLPNLMMVTNAVKRIRPSGTIISATVSLGYDVAQSRVEPLLLEAAQKSGLDDPFVRILDLGDHAVTYKVAGFLKDPAQMLATRSDLRAAMLSALHSNGVEIVSPEFRNTRQVDKQSFIPPKYSDTGEAPKSRPETTVFDKAEKAASIESLRKMVLELEEKQKALESSETNGEPGKKEGRDKELAQITLRLERLARLIADREATVADEE